MCVVHVCVCVCVCVCACACACACVCVCVCVCACICMCVRIKILYYISVLLSNLFAFTHSIKSLWVSFYIRIGIARQLFQNTLLYKISVIPQPHSIAIPCSINNLVSQFFKDIIHLCIVFFVTAEPC